MKKCVGFSLLCVILLAAFVSAVYASSFSPAALRRTSPPEGAFWLDGLDLSKVTQGWGAPRGAMTVQGSPLMLKSLIYSHGLGMAADSAVVLDVNGAATRFVAMAGVDDLNRGPGSVIFEIWLDGKKSVSVGPLRKGDAPKMIEADLTGVKQMYLIAQGTQKGSPEDFADWGGALLVPAPGATAKPAFVQLPPEAAPPIAHTDPDAVGIHGPRILGTTPGRPFLFLVPATGKPPLKFAAKNLPDGLALDPDTGIISGSLKSDGETVVEITLTAANGVSKRKLTISAGAHRLALTPPMGWNSWNVWGTFVDARKVRAAADAFLKTGLAAHGFRYVNIDDAWEGGRDANGEIKSNPKFPDMKKLSDYVHSKGLMLGIYSSPGPKTCGGYEASWQHEKQDAATWARWGIDYLKYDWCSYSQIEKARTKEALMKPYTVMREALDAVDRDIVYSLCQYGMGDVWTWGTEVGGNLWRTTGDINDSWTSLSEIGFSQNGHEKYAGPGHWNDPDMLVVGRVGWGPTLHPSKLAPNEQITHITLWSMLSAPLLIGCDLTKLDAFTTDLLTNDEVIDIDQDPLGKPAGRVARGGMTEVWARPLWDGTVAVALFNRFFAKQDVTARWADIGVSGSQPVRDLWQKKDLGVFDGSITLSVPAHGAVLLKIGVPKSED